MTVAGPIPERPITPGAAEALPRGAAGRVWRGAISDPGTLAGGIVVLVILVVALFAPWLAPHDPNFQEPNGLTLVGEPYSPAHGGFLLGTDQLGRDLLSRLIYGTRVAMFIALVPNALALLLATAVGVTAGYFGGKVDLVLMRFTEMVMVLPTFLLALALLAVFGSGLHVIVIALVLVSWTYPARVVYGEVLRLRESPFVEAAKALGSGAPRIIVRHIVPQLRVLLMVYFTLNAAFMVLAEAGLSFLGVGIQPPTPSWGGMIGEAQELFFWPWLIVLPGVCLALLVVGFYLLGNGLQRRWGPRLHRIRL